MEVHLALYSFLVGFFARIAFHRPKREEGPQQKPLMMGRLKGREEIKKMIANMPRGMMVKYDLGSIKALEEIERVKNKRQIAHPNASSLTSDDHKRLNELVELTLLEAIDKLLTEEAIVENPEKMKVMVRVLGNECMDPSMKPYFLVQKGIEFIDWVLEKQKPQPQKCYFQHSAAMEEKQEEEMRLMRAEDRYDFMCKLGNFAMLSVLGLEVCLIGIHIRRHDPFDVSSLFECHSLYGEFDMIWFAALAAGFLARIAWEFTKTREPEPVVVRQVYRPSPITWELLEQMRGRAIRDIIAKEDRKFMEAVNREAKNPRYSASGIKVSGEKLQESSLDIFGWQLYYIQHLTEGDFSLAYRPLWASDRDRRSGFRLILTFGSIIRGKNRF